MTIRRISDLYLGSITTSKVVSISSAETVYTIGSGNRALEITNLGAYSIMYGQSGVLVNSGGIITANGSKFWDGVVGDFTLYLVVGSGGVTSNAVVQEYAGQN